MLQNRWPGTELAETELWCPPTKPHHAAACESESRQ